MRRLPALLLFILTTLSLSTVRAGDLDARLDHALRFARLQLKNSVRALHDPTRYPRSSGLEGGWTVVPPSDWTSGFFPGCLWLTYELTKDQSFRVAAERWTSGLEGAETQQRNTRYRVHDLLQFRQRTPPAPGFRLPRHSPAGRPDTCHPIQPKNGLHQVVGLEHRVAIPGDHRQYDESRTSLLGVEERRRNRPPENRDHARPHDSKESFSSGRWDVSCS